MNAFVIAAFCAILATSNAGVINSGLISPIGVRTIGNTILTEPSLALSSGLGWSGRSIIDNGVGLVGSPIISGRTLIDNSGLGLVGSAPLVSGRTLIDNAGLGLVRSAPLVSAPLVSTQVVRKSLIDNAGLRVQSVSAPLIASSPVIAARGVLAAPAWNGIDARSVLSAPLVSSGPIVAGRTLIDNAGLATSSIAAPWASSLAAPAWNGLAWSNGYGVARSGLLNDAVWNGVARTGLVANQW